MLHFPEPVSTLFVVARAIQSFLNFVKKDISPLHPHFRIFDDLDRFGFGPHRMITMLSRSISL